GASTLGKISGATLNVALNPQGIKLGDGLTGYGAVLPGQVVLSGQITALFTDSALADFAEQHTSKTLVIETAAKSGETLKVTMPSAEFGEPSMDFETKQGIVRTYPWTAHWKTGDAAVTAVLTNNLASVTATG
ncbi:MAG: phage tail tube protein, partial [Gammaproteobacteria bacterium]